MKILCLLLTVCFSSLAANDFDGHWQGSYVLKGYGWPMRLHIKTNDEKISTRLDIPNLVFADVEVESFVTGLLLKVEMPFGLKPLNFEYSEGQLKAQNYQHSTDFIRSDDPPYTVESISWKSDDETLFGSLYLPNDKKRHPLLIRLHGSATGSREHWEYNSWGDHFARKGIATVVFDRRAEGDSLSEINNIGFELLAKDVHQLIQSLKYRADIDTNKIILNGGSQAAYISMLANSMSEDVDYMLLSGAPSVKLIEQEKKSLLFRMKANQESEESINEALGYLDLYFHFVRTGQNWKALKAAIEKHKNKSWSKYTDFPMKQSDLKWWRENYKSFDPYELIPEIDIPVLLLFGENDSVTPPSVMVPGFQYLLKGSRNDSIDIVICPDVGHSLEEPFRKDKWGQIVFPQKSKIMFQAIDKWLIKHGITDD